MSAQLSLAGVPAPVAPAAPRVVERWAEFSPCGAYRYLLGRRWAPGPLCLFVCLNPSDADAEKDDATCHRMMHFAEAWGHGGLLGMNLAGLVSSKPRALWEVADPIGPRNDARIREVANDVIAGGGRLVAAWGCSVPFDDKAPRLMVGRDVAMRDLLTSIGDVYCLGRNADGSPKHPHARGRHRAPDDQAPILFAKRRAS
jgi:hypothetical protein